MTRPAPLTGLLEAAIYADDLAAAAAFYGSLLGLDMVLEKPGAHLFFRCGTTILLVFRPTVTRKQTAEGRLPVPPHGAEGAGHVCFAVPGAELDRWAARMKEAGIEIEADFHWPNGARSIYVRDPAGNSVEFAEPKLWETAP